ncbi:hypothetical protein FH972_022239 [Carpinus fangiana]|uniref:GCS light chain n=1 Tax=Carpinus fangiana TaxID=176857 RepID=A0A5N6KRN6_9ROSI|nr:hypothetical protein FH972_022239 [Carpinus fangiana]
MTKLILSTSNIMGGGPSIIRGTAQKSNTEFTSALRANFTAAQQITPQTHDHHNGTTKTAKPLSSTWTSREGDELFIPSVDFTTSGLAEERAQYEITVKLFFLPHKPASSRCAQTRRAIDLVLKELHVPSIDLLIVSFPGISFDAEDEGDGSRSETGSQTDDETDGHANPEDIDSMVKTWECLEGLHDKGVIDCLGLSEFGSERLSKFLAKVRVRPTVNQINVRDCCVVPRSLILYAKSEKIELLTHNDCTNILPRGTVRELLGQGDRGAGVLADETKGIQEGIKGEVEPQWVIKYTAVVKDRGVVEDKGYFALAEVV